MSEQIKEEEVEAVEEISEDAKEPKARARAYHVSYDSADGRWKIFLEKGKAICKFPTKEEALNRVKELSRNNERGYIVHKKDGKLQKKR